MSFHLKSSSHQLRETNLTMFVYYISIITEICLYRMYKSTIKYIFWVMYVLITLYSYICRSILDCQQIQLKFDVLMVNFSV